MGGRMIIYTQRCPVDCTLGRYAVTCTQLQQGFADVDPKHVTQVQLQLLCG